MPIALIAGICAAIVSAVVWAAVTVVTEYQIGWMAVGVGILVGFAVRLGKGVDNIFRYIGAVLALVGCVLGNFFTIVGFISKEENIDVFNVISLINYTEITSLMMETASPMDLLFYAIAIYEGYKFSVKADVVDEVMDTPPAA